MCIWLLVMYVVDGSSRIFSVQAAMNLDLVGDKRNEIVRK